MPLRLSSSRIAEGVARVVRVGVRSDLIEARQPGTEAQCVSERQSELHRIDAEMLKHSWTMNALNRGAL